MFDSGKQNGFKALIYMHRYAENMVAKIRTDYLHTLQRKYESEINRLDNDMNYRFRLWCKSKLPEVLKVWKYHKETERKI